VQRGFEDEHAVVARLRPPRKACLEPASDQPSGDQLSQVREAFLAAILGGHRAGALNIVEEALRAGHCHVDLYVDVFAESLRRIAALWEQNKISVAQEHTATSITQYAIAAIYPRLAPTGAHRGSMVVPALPGNSTRSAPISWAMPWKRRDGRCAFWERTCRIRQSWLPSKRVR
jgi:hypothetical protein